MAYKITIAGYYGANNTGDEAILTGILHALKKYGLTEVTVLSRDPENTEQIHGVNSIHIGRRLEGLREIYRTLRNSDVFLLGGGGLLQDYSRRVVPYWLSRVALARLARIPTMYYAQGIGPLRTSMAKQMVRFCSNGVSMITVRDQPSRELLENLGVTKPHIEVTADPAFGIDVPNNGEQLLAEDGLICNRNRYLYIGVSLRNWFGEETYLPQLIQVLQQLQQERPIFYVFFPFQFSADETISERVMQHLDPERVYFVKKQYTPVQMAAMVSTLDGMLAMRLHALILSAISCVPCFGLSYDPKVTQFMDRVELERYCIPIESFAKESSDVHLRLQEWLDTLTDISEGLVAPVNRLRERAFRNAALVKKLLER